MESRFAKFTQSRQEPLRLAIALSDCFAPDCPPQARAAYEAYLRRRIRPATAALVRSEDIDTLARLSDALTRPLTDELLALSIREQRTAALVWLLRFKGERFGFAPAALSL